MSNARRATHPKDLPYLVAAEGDEANPPHMVLFGSKLAALDHAKTRAFNDCKPYLVFKVEEIASVRPQEPVVTEHK